MNRAVVRKLLASSSVLFGIAWICMIFGSIVISIWGESDWSGRGFSLCFSAILCLPGLFLIISGIGLWKSLSLHSLSMGVGTIAVVLVLWLSAFLSENLLEIMDLKDLGVFVSMVLAAIVVIPGYLWMMSRFWRFFTDEKVQMSGFLTSGALGLISFLLVMGLMDFFEYAAEVWPGSWVEEFEDLLILGSVAVGLLFYKVGCLVLPVDAKNMSAVPRDL